jgi:hypothetical protein
MIVKTEERQNVLYFLHRCQWCGREVWTRKAQLHCCSSPPAAGPGTELKLILAGYGITAESGCQCEEHAAEMNRRGPAWCRENIEAILDWLQQAARQRGWSLLFNRTFVRELLVLPAIARAERQLVRP